MARMFDGRKFDTRFKCPKRLAIFNAKKHNIGQPGRVSMVNEYIERLNKADAILVDRWYQEEVLNKIWEY